MEEVSALSITSKFIEEELSRSSIFKDEAPLSIEYVPDFLPHREQQLRFLTQLFRFTIDKPGSMGQKVLITGDVGTGKTVLAQRFGLDMVRVAKARKIPLRYIHVNCREAKGSLFMVLKNAVKMLAPKFPHRGFGAEELLRSLLKVLDRRGVFLILALDELESLVRVEGGEVLYALTRAQENRMSLPLRLSFIFILRDLNQLRGLDRSIIGTLQQNIIKLDRYTSEQLETILRYRSELSLREGVIADENLSFIADIASTTGDARYAIELLWRAGKYADAEGSAEITSDHIRRAAGSLHPAFREEYVKALSVNEKLFLLALARALKSSKGAYATMGEVEELYEITCEEYGEEPRAHTQIWKYAKSLNALGIVIASKSSKGTKGKTTILSFPSVPSGEMERWLESHLEALKREAQRRALLR
ncbi:MAG: ORC1-type DNA replication protein [Candidatus Bathyarchaeia archaeon]